MRSARTIRPVALLLLFALTASASLIMDRAPEARAVAEIFIDEAGVRMEWEVAEGTQPVLDIDPAAARRPARITIRPPMGTGQHEIGFVVYHLGLPVSDAHYLTNEETVELDWRDPWQSHLLNPRLRRAYDSPLGVFLHVGRYEVRVEVVGRPVDFGIEQVDRATVAEQVDAALAGRWHLKVDGAEVRPPLDRCEFVERRLRSTSVVEAPAPDSARTSTLGVVYRLRRESFPHSAELEWDYFPPGVPRLTASVTEDFIMSPAVLRPGKNTLEWEAGAPPPEPAVVAVPNPPSLFERWFPYAGWLAVAGCLGFGFVAIRRVAVRRSAPRGLLVAVFGMAAMASIAFSRGAPGTLDEAEIRRITGALLENVYHAYDYPTDEAIYDALARSITGDFLTEAFLQVRRALELERTGGASIRVSAVDVEAASPETVSADRLETRATWTVAGSVAHWGHVHARRNRYSGRLTVVANDGAWRIARIELLNEERIPAPRIQARRP